MPEYTLVNATNQFLLEYAPLEENSCHNLTGFTGDTADALVLPDGSVKLFVDGRYHTQADLEVDKSKVEVVKLALGQKVDDAICDFVAHNSKLNVCSHKISQKRFEYLESLLKKKNVTVCPLEVDIYEKPHPKRKSKAAAISRELSGENFSDKIKKIEKPALITNSEELSYYCNIRDFSQKYAVKVDGKLLLLDGRSILFTDYEVNSDDFEVMPLNEFENFISNIYLPLPLPLRVDKSTITARDYSLLKQPVSITPKNTKSIKNSSEINHLKYCFEMTDKALYDTRNFIYENDNLSEYDIDLELERNFKKYGARLLSFKSIVARNQNSAQAHYMKSSKNEIIKEGDLILIDCGAYYEGGLATDITRVFVKGGVNELQRKVYTTVLEMFLNAYNYQVVEGVTTGFEIDEYVRKLLSKMQIEDFAFSHGLGHGLGICVHEAPPNLSMNEIAKTPIYNNMCFTIEPGLYSKDKFGVRLENSCYLENGKIKSFSNMCYEKKLIDYTMLNKDEIEMLNAFRVE